MDTRPCRMVKSRFPAEGDVVMAKIDKIYKKSVTVSLVEYNNLEGRLLLSHDDTCVQKSLVGRLEPLKVFIADKRKQYFLLDRSSVSFDERCACEQEYNKRIYVRSVLVSVAEENGKSLKEMYHLTRWPSYEELKNLHEADWLESTMGTELRSYLLDRIKLMRYNSWRIRDPSILRLFSLYHQLAACWAFALVAATEAFLKINDRLPRDFYLSVQDLLNNVPKKFFVGGADGDIADLEHILPVLERKGLIRGDECPGTLSLVGEPREDMTNAYRVEEVELMNEEKCGFPEGEGFLDDLVIGALDTCPVCLSVIWFPSYYGRKDEGIFKPTRKEQKAFKNNRCVNDFVHTMLLAGEGVDRYGVEFLELQDFGGDVNNGDRGFLRFARRPSPVIEFITLRI